MATLLHIDASARKSRSITRSLGTAFKTQWLSANAEDKFIYRDVGSAPPEFIGESWIDAAFTPENERTEEQASLLSQSDLLIDEVSEASVIVISTPMYNYGMPAALKAWVDQIVRVNKTFSFDLSRGDFPLEPILSGKALVLLTSCGEFGFGKGEARENMNHLTPHLRTVSKYLGVEETHELRVEYQEFGDARHKASIEQAYKAIPEMVSKLSTSLAMSA
ncbi:NAD(P)H-dependent oxidoreductase [Aestuariicella sp. G3-2]|uniref:FMN-dependent NADH-azoreductase n=1 Tax=Pseudomaricurvus albidus TaxID=2842452 RepID=UPI001C0E3B84|nr:NAD(P)H-dependent oxidoreductase [Aestuariicella albida]MBU3068836.1 NAD(P)H-dependent oxidoreductase [Aestuariicella albida]